MSFMIVSTVLFFFLYQKSFAISSRDENEHDLTNARTEIDVVQNHHERRELFGLADTQGNMT